MDVDALLEAFQDFEKKGKKETCPALEQFLCHVAKTGQPMLSWSQFKTYFMFKLEKVMDDFNTSTPEQRSLHNPNVEYVPFEEMKTRIIKIVDGYNGIPFTIQRLCELLTDPKRNYTGTEKFLRGLEKNVMVVSCVYTGASSVNRMNGVMFPGNSSLYSESRNVNGPGLPKPLSRPKLSFSPSLSTNGLPDCSVSKEPESATEEQHHGGESSLSGHVSPNSKHKHSEEEEEEEDADKQEIKRLKLGEKEEEETSGEGKESQESAESSSETLEPSKESCQPDFEGETSCDTPSVSDSHEPSSTKPEPTEEEEEEEEEEGEYCESEAAHSGETSHSAAEQQEQPVSSEDRMSVETMSTEKKSPERTSVEPDSSDNSDGENSATGKQKPSSCNSPDPPTEGDTDISSSAETTAD